MNPAHDIDQHARRLHQASLAQVSPQTLMRLRRARHDAQQHATTPADARHRGRWLMATAFSAVLAVGVGLQWLPHTPGATPSTTTITSASQAEGDIATDELGVASAFDEDPDLYLWLASADAQPLAMESTP